MKQSVYHWQITGFLFTSVLGAFLRFLFDLSGQSVLAASFSAVNESIGEIMKPIYCSMFPSSGIPLPGAMVFKDEPVEGSHPQNYRR